MTSEPHQTASVRLRIWTVLIEPKDAMEMSGAFMCTDRLVALEGEVARPNALRNKTAGVAG